MEIPILSAAAVPKSAGHSNHKDRSCNNTAVAERVRIVLYSHDTLGFGHLRRNLLLAGALRTCGSNPEILMIAGMREAGAFEMPCGVDCLTLPAYSKSTDGVYQPRDLGQDLGQLARLRSGIIKAAIENFNPDLVIVDNVPRGAQSELNSSLDWLRKNGSARLVLGLRDVIDSPSMVRKQWLKQRNFEAIRDYYDEVWIYGDPALYDIVEDCGFAGDFHRKSVFTGYLNQCMRMQSRAALPCRDAVLGSDPRPYFICVVGGGKDGSELCEAFARSKMPEGHRGVLVTGSQMSEESSQIIEKLVDANPDLSMVEFIREPIALMQGAAGIVCMAGYNTVCEVLSLHRPALLVPRVAPRQEQWLRAQRVSAMSLVDAVHPAELSCEYLSRWMAKLPEKPPVDAGAIIDMNGLARVTELANQILSGTAAPLYEAS